MADRYSMLKAHRWSAYWWRADKDTHQVAGQVTVDENGVHLHGIGSSLTTKNSSFDQDETFNIDGVLGSGLIFSARDCVQLNHNLGQAKTPFEGKYRALALYLGAHSAFKIPIRTSYSDSPVLDPWMGPGGTAMSTATLPDGRVVPIIVPQDGQSFEIAVPSVGTVDLRRSTAVEQQFIRYPEVKATERGSVAITTSDALPVKQALSLHSWFHSLIELLTDAASPTEHLSFKVSDNKLVHVLTGIRTDFREHAMNDNIHPGRFPAWSGAVHSEVGLTSAIANWFEHRDTFDLAFGLLREVRRSDSVLEFKVLALAQALEGFHRRAYPSQSKYLTDDDYEPIRDHIVGAIPASVVGPFRQALKKRLDFGNESSLRRRIKFLIDELPESVKPALGPRPRHWSDTFVDMRNNLTHLPEGYQGLSPDSDVEIEILRGAILLHAHLLMQLGLSRDFVGEAMKRTHAWDSLIVAGLLPRPKF